MGGTMNISRSILILLIVMSLCVGCACNKKKTDTPSAPANGVLLYSQTNDFAFQLYAKADQDGKNLFYSPYSISSALSMCYGGAKGNTATEMAKALCFNLPQDEQHKGFKALQQQLNDLGKRDKAELNVANGLFGAKKNESLLLPDYLKLLRDSYSSEVYSLDFANAKGTAKYINTWVEGKTKDRIKDLVTEEQIKASNDGLVLVNAIYFKGKWLVQFDPKKTDKADFYTSSKDWTPKTAKTVQMMSLQGDFSYAEMPGCKVLELPYEEKDLAMLFVLPDEIKGFGDQLNSKSLQTWQNALRPQEVKVFIPRYKFELTLEGLPDKLKSMGMNDAFSDLRADFSGIRRGGGLYILDIVHKAFVEVKEEGTEAAAATAVIMATKAAPGPEQTIPVFRADHPFIYMIIHKPTNTVLFLGKYTTPPEK